MDKRAAFKFNFLLKCAEAGLSPADAVEVARRAAGVQEKRAWSMLDNPLIGAAVMGLGLAGAGGAVGGHYLASLSEPTFDPEKVKRQEVIQALQQETERAKRNTALLRRPSQPAKPQFNRF